MLPSPQYNGLHSAYLSKCQYKDHQAFQLTDLGHQKYVSYFSNYVIELIPDLSHAI